MKSGFYHLSAFIIAALLFPGCQGEAEQRHILITENGMKLEVPEGYVIETVAGSDLVDYPMFATLDDRGRLFVFESIGNVYENSQEAIDTPQFQIKLLKDLDDDGIYDQATIFADSLSFPQGGVVVDGSLYASSAPDLIKLTDTDDDGVADQREVLLSGWVLNVNANSLIGPFLGPDGLLYLTSAIEGFDIKNREGHQISGETARVWRVKSDGSELEWISAGGMNNPVELAFTPAGEVMGTLTFFVDPQRGLRDALTYWIEGGVYGKENSNIERDQLPRTGELMPVVTPYSRVAPSGLTIYRQSGLGESYTNNLFSVQFNTHQVWRHQLRRRGGGFSTVDDVFLTCDHPDFHPTDVLEAGDGSLLIVETGGWFILGCPLSQVSKPQLEGGIYSVKKANSSEKRDPYGKSIDWEASGEEELLKLATDPRIFVRDQAFKALIKHETGIDILKKIMDRDSEELRLRATYALYQTGSETAMHLIKERLMDSSVDVRIAAAKCAGLSKNQLFTDALIQQLSDTSRAVKRQVATALGQIGNPIATRPLLEAATGEEDRYVLHAITFALIQSGSEAVLLDALSDQDPVTRQVALVSLDQTESSPLSLDEVLPFIQDPSNLLARTGLWVASHHPGWARSMVPFLKKQIADNSIRSFDYEVFEELLITFSEDEQIQQWLAQNLMTVNSDSTRDLIQIHNRLLSG